MIGHGSPSPSRCGRWTQWSQRAWAGVTIGILFIALAPHSSGAEQRTLRMGPAIVASTCTAIRVGQDAQDLAEAQFATARFVAARLARLGPFDDGVMFGSFGYGCGHRHVLHQE